MNNIVLVEKRRWRSLFPKTAFACLAIALSALPATAQSATGQITGRVLNPATNEYLRNAEVRVQGTNLVVNSGEGGYYELRNVPAGQATIIVTYPGAESAAATISVSPGAAAKRDFEIALTSSRRTGDDVVKLGAFVVETEREGQSKMVAEQKQAVNIKQVMSTDNFGDMSEQNIGEFLKYLPGINIDYVETDTRAASMGGMDPKYGYVTLDGNAQASGASGNLGVNSRQFEFESISMNNIESIEVNKTLTADMWADAPAGTVNLRTRSALDQKRPKGSATTGFMWNSLEHSLKATPRHDDGLHPKVRPRLSFDYSTGAIMDGKLGITINGSFTSIFKLQYREGLTYDYTSTQALAAGRPLLTAVNFKDGPKISDKSSGGAKIDYQPFRGLRITTAVSYSYFNDFFANRNLNFVTTAANLGAGSSLTKVVAINSNNTNTRIDQSGETTGKLKDNTNLSVMANYKRGPWTADLSLLYSRARETRGALFYGTIGNTPVRLSRIGFTAERTDVESAAWAITQTSGGDWYNWANWGIYDAQDLNANYQQAKTEQWTGKVDLKRVMSWERPTTYKFGVGESVFFNHNWVSRSYVGRYVGPTGNALTSPMPQSMAYFDINEGFGGGIGHLPVVDKEAMYVLLRDHPQYFTQSEGNLASQINNVAGSFQTVQEDVRALYGMQETRLGKWQLIGGLRMENTRTSTRVPGEVPIPQNPFKVTTTAVVNGVTTTVYRAATTQAYANYRWSGPKESVWGTYTDFLPSAAAKYQINKDLNLKLGYNKAIKRPDLDKTAGSMSYGVNDATGDITVTVPNPNLKPERSDRISAMLEWYFEPAGTASIHLYQSNITNAIDTNTEGVTANEAGFTGAEFAGFLFQTYHNLDEKRVIRGIELSYSQQLTFLPNEWLRTTSVWANYAQNCATPRPRTGTRYVPRSASGGIRWNTPNRKLSFAVNATWTDETFTGSNSVPVNAPLTPNQPEYFRPRTILFINAAYKLPKGMSLFVSGDRAYDSGKIWYYKYDGRIRQQERYGAQWSAGIKGEF
jgi:iron complex outermembrane recepter protein